MLRAYNLRKSRAKFSLRASSPPIWVSEASLARTRERAAKPRGAEGIGELARWIGKARRLARLHALLLPAPYIFLVLSMHITRETKSSNLIIFFLPDSTYYKVNNILKTFLVMQRRGTIVF